MCPKPGRFCGGDAERLSQKGRSGGDNCDMAKKLKRAWRAVKPAAGFTYRFVSEEEK